MRTAMVAALAVAIAACRPTGKTGATTKATEPAASGIQAYVRALRSDDPKPAYAMLADETRRTIPFEEFAILWKQNRVERTHQAQELEEGLKGDPNLGERSRVVYRDGRAVHLLRENSEWKLESALVSRMHAATRHEALAAFAEALAARNYEAVLRILTSRRRDSITEKVDLFVTSLLENLGQPDNAVDLIGKDRAEMQWEDGDKRYKIVLKKEGDEWRVDDFDIRAAPPTGNKPKARPRR